MLFAIVFALSAADQVYVSSIGADELAQKCAAANEGARGFCNGYALGVFDRLSSSRKICPRNPKDLTIKAMAVARDYLAAHPERGPEEANTVLTSAFEAAFPC